jgi:hypothetical protein
MRSPASVTAASAAVTAPAKVSLVGPSVATGGTLAPHEPAWPMIGLGALGIAMLVGTAVVLRRTRRTSGR